MNVGNQVNLKPSQSSFPMKRPSSTFDSFWLNYGTKKKKKYCKTWWYKLTRGKFRFYNLRIHRWNLKTSSVLSRVLITGHVPITCRIYKKLPINWLISKTLCYSFSITRRLFIIITIFTDKAMKYWICSFLPSKLAIVDTSPGLLQLSTMD